MSIGSPAAHGSGSGLQFGYFDDAYDFDEKIPAGTSLVTQDSSQKRRDFTDLKILRIAPFDLELAANSRQRLARAFDP
jgi:hypothetical protein